MTPGWTTIATRRPPARRRYTPLILAVALAALVWAIIAWGGALLGRLAGVT